MNTLVAGFRVTIWLLNNKYTQQYDFRIKKKNAVEKKKKF